MKTHHALYSLPNLQRSRINENEKRAEQVRDKNYTGKVCRVLVAKPELHKLRGRPKLNLKDNIKVDLKEKVSSARKQMLKVNFFFFNKCYH
jgi:hypothetical protein